MMTKEGFLRDVRSAAQQKLVTFQELTQTFNGALYSQSSVTQVSKEQKVGVTEVMYFIGGTVVFLGITVLLSQHWKDLSFLTKLLSTLGAGCATYYVGLLMAREDHLSRASQAFFLISALVLPMGLDILFDHNGYSINHLDVQVMISGILTGFFLASYAIFRMNVFLVFIILYATWFFHSGTAFFINDRPELRTWKLTDYRFLVNGLTYILLGYSFSQNPDCRPLSDTLYGAGVFFFLCATFALGGWKPDQSIFWETLFPGLILGVFFLSVYLKSKSFLTFGALFMVAYIGKMTAEYFQDSLGWPLSLVLIGFGLMGVGYAAYGLNAKYFKPGDAK